MSKYTLYDKIWNNHLINEDNNKSIIYIDLHLIHEVTSPQAFESLKLSNRLVRRPNLSFATVDHNVPTKDRFNIKDPISKKQIDKLAKNCKKSNIKLFGLDSPNQGIVHVIGPELGLTSPGKTIVCGDSHTSTHGAFGALAFGIGTSEVEHVLATQCLQQKKSKNMKLVIKNELAFGLTSKDVILGIIDKYGTDFATGHVIEYTGEAIKKMSMEERMTICNMSIEAGARAGLIAPDETTFNYLRGKKYSLKDEAFENEITKWKGLYSDENAEFDSVIEFDLDELEPQVTWGTNPSMGSGINGKVPNPKDIKDPNLKKATIRALEYMGLEPDTKMKDIEIDFVFIGSCTNGRIEDLRNVAKIVEGNKISNHVTGLIVPGSQYVKKQAEEEGLDKIFLNAGFEWREAGCSMCLAMNPDFLKPGERCASTSNRNFEGRQGRQGRTHLVSPKMAAAAAIHGHFVDIRDIAQK
jgi:3-isopropylmalate/(R)-2-methylmalate dehydratase large subunit